MTQEELAAKAEMDRSYLARIESGNAKASVDLIERLAMGLEVAPEKLLHGYARSAGALRSRNGSHQPA